MPLLVVQGHILIGLIVSGGVTQFLGLADHLFEEPDGLDTPFALEPLDMDFDLSGEADGDFVFARFHGLVGRLEVLWKDCIRTTPQFCQCRTRRRMD